MTLVSKAKADVPPVGIISETSMSAHATDLGTHASTLELFIRDDEPTRGLLEWDIPTLDETTQYGLWFERVGKRYRLRDYDGGFSLPREAIAFLRAQGYVIPRNFE